MGRKTLPTKLKRKERSRDSKRFGKIKQTKFLRTLRNIVKESKKHG